MKLNFDEFIRLSPEDQADYRDFYGDKFSDLETTLTVEELVALKRRPAGHPLPPVAPKGAGDKRQVRCKGENIGLLSLGMINTRIKWGVLDDTGEYWSQKDNCWRPLKTIMEDFPEWQSSNKRVEEMLRCGIKFVAVLGVDETDCAACLALQKRKIPIADAPHIPPLDCVCVPYCRCCIIAEQ